MTSPAVLVVDASVAVKWYVPEPGARDAAALLRSDADLVAPDLLVAELGNVLWKKVSRGELIADEAREIATAFTSTCPLALYPSSFYLSGALDIALRFQRSVYDALYLAVALAEEGRYATANERLANALATTDLAPTVWLLGT